MNEQETIISKSIINSISKLREDNELNDFQVIIDGEIIPCHSFILASCSEFFRCLLRSNMKEKLEMKVNLSNISSSIFQLILKSLYTGCGLLTKENVLEVWSAVHQLQIQFLIDLCEDFVKTNLSLDTMDAYKQNAELLNCDRICTFIFTFICEHFESFRKTEEMLNLNFKDLTEIFTSDQLKISSEDEVLFSIFDWVSHEPSDRKKFLMPLLKSSRYCLASDFCISRLYNNKLITSDILVKEILFEAFTFKSVNYVQGFWPSAASHRDCSNLKHVGVFWLNGKISAVCLKQNKEFGFQNLPKLNSKITVFNGKLYSCSTNIDPNEVYVLQTNKWVLVTKISHSVQLLLTHEMHIYVFDCNEKKITRFNPESSPIMLETFSHDIENLTYALSFRNNILAFSSADINGEEETGLQSWDTVSNVWVKLENSKFSPQNMISFRNDSDTYILDCNGGLWKLINSEIIGFTFVDKIWKGKNSTIGAVFYRESLFLLFYDCKTIYGLKKEIKGIFSIVELWTVNDINSNFVHYVVSKDELKPV